MISTVWVGTAPLTPVLLGASDEVSLAPRLRGPAGPRQLIGKPNRVIDSRYVTNPRPDRWPGVAQLLGRLGD